jgi:hypothetical protein
MVMSIQDDASLYNIEPWNLPRLSLGIYIYFNTLGVLVGRKSGSRTINLKKPPLECIEHAFQL